MDMVLIPSFRSFIQTWYSQYLYLIDTVNCLNPFLQVIHSNKEGVMVGVAEKINEVLIPSFRSFIQTLYNQRKNSPAVERSLNPFLQVIHSNIDLWHMVFIRSHSLVLIPSFRSFIQTKKKMASFWRYKRSVLIPSFRSFIQTQDSSGWFIPTISMVLIPSFRSFIQTLIGW